MAYELNIIDLKTAKGHYTWESETNRIGQQSVGEIGLKNFGSGMFLFELDEFDTSITSHVVLKQGEKVMRYETSTTRVGGFMPMVKINFEKGLVYFMKENDEVIEFDSRGVKALWISVNKTAI